MQLAEVKADIAPFSSAYTKSMMQKRLRHVNGAFLLFNIRLFFQES